MALEYPGINEKMSVLRLQTIEIYDACLVSHKSSHNKPIKCIYILYPILLLASSNSIYP